jgi:hypothetical protein
MRLDVVAPGPNVGLGVDTSPPNVELGVVAPGPNMGLGVDASTPNIELGMVVSGPTWDWVWMRLCPT